MNANSISTRRGLHAAAELLIAGPQYREHGTIRLRVTPEGIEGARSPIRIVGAEIIGPRGRAALTGSIREIAAAIGVEAGAPVGVYADTTDFGVDDSLDVDAAAARAVLHWFAVGDDALRTLGAGAPVLWPEHFDVAVSLDEVNYGVSPGDSFHALPYAYVGPWTVRTGGFWNAPFGAVRSATEFADADGVAAFFLEGRDAAHAQ